MAEKGKMNTEHLGGVVRLREEHQKVIQPCDLKHFAGYPLSFRQTAAAGHAVEQCGALTCSSTFTLSPHICALMVL